MVEIPGKNHKTNMQKPIEPTKPTRFIEKERELTDLAGSSWTLQKIMEKLELRWDNEFDPEQLEIHFGSYDERPYVKYEKPIRTLVPQEEYDAQLAQYHVDLENYYEKLKNYNNQQNEFHQIFDASHPSILKERQEERRKLYLKLKEEFTNE